MNKEHLKLLVSFPFIISICLLISNDFFFKPFFHNWFTGKLSDFAGLFAFPLFCYAIYPQYKKIIYLLVFVSFIFWKSLYSQPLIEAWNALSILPIGRVIDPTDLIALLILPISYLYSNFKRKDPIPRIAIYFMILISVFAFTATTPAGVITDFDYNNSYLVSDSQIELIRKIYHLQEMDNQYSINAHNIPSYNSVTMDVQVPTDTCSKYVRAFISISELDNQSKIILNKMHYYCENDKLNKQQLLNIFEQHFINKLKAINFNLFEIKSNEVSIIPNKSRLKGHGSIYFVIIGELTDLNKNALIEYVDKEYNMQLYNYQKEGVGFNLITYFHEKYDLNIQLLSPISLENNQHKSDFLAAEELITLIKKKNPEIVSNPNTIIIGITEDMYIPGNYKLHKFDYKADDRFAIVAIKPMNPTIYSESENQSLLMLRLQKILAQNIGSLYYHLPYNTNPTSIMYSSLGCVHELDHLEETF